MEIPKEQNSKLQLAAQKYEKVLRARMDKLKQGGATGTEVKEIYKRALLNLTSLNEKSSPQDKAASIELAVVDTLGLTRYEVITTQSKLKKNIKFRIKNVLDPRDQPNE